MSGQPRRTRPTDRKGSILEAATEAFASAGYHETSMADIAARVGISSTALYRHFAGKQDLLGQTLLQGLNNALQRLEQAPGPVLDELVDTALEFRRLPRLWQTEARNLADDDRMALRAQVLRLNQLLCGEVAKMRPDLSAANVEFVAWCVFSVATSPSQYNLQLPRATFARQLRAMIGDVVGASVPEFVGNRKPAQRHWTENVQIGPMEGELRRERLLVAAARLFAARGYSAVAMEDIGAAASITGSSVYHHFDGKAELLAEVVDRSDQWIRLSSARALIVGETPLQTLQLLLDSYVRFAVEQPAFAIASITEAGHLTTTKSAQFRHTVRRAVSGWSRLLQVARPDLCVGTCRCVSVLTVHATSTTKGAADGALQAQRP